MATCWGRMGRRGGAGVVALALALLSGCATPAERFTDYAAVLGLDRRVAAGSGFRHVLFWSHPERPAPVLHVYVDGDGTPEIGGYPAADPTPRNPLMLRLLRLDPGPAVLIGRPCYYGLATDASCHPGLWTEARYSDAVVTSMAAVVRRLLELGSYRRVAWFGHSGGGTLAVLLAGRVPESAAVVTVAANLDIDAWADHRHARRLSASLNPALQPPLSAAIAQHHYAGARDDIVPAEVTRRGLTAAVELTVIPNYDHRCCWERLWPMILAGLAQDGL